MPEYAAVFSLGEAVSILASGTWKVLAGGTDYYPARVALPARDNVLDISNLAELRSITEEVDCWRLGALTTWSDIVNAQLPPMFKGLQLAAREVGARQIQNAATIAGNLCNASPAADGVPPLLTLDAEVELTSSKAVRKVSLSEFIKGNRDTLIADDELMTAILVPKIAGEVNSGFLKLGSRSYLVISIAMVAALIEVTKDRKVAKASISVGACSVVAQRLRELEAELVGKTLSSEIVDVVESRHFASLTPIDDVRATAAYRLAMAEEMVRRVLVSCVEGN